MTSLKPLNRETANKPVRFPERIVQFGAGNFLRAFADWAIQELNDKADFNSSVVVVKVTPRSTYMELDAQDGLFHLHLEGIQAGELVSETHLIECISRTVYPYDDYEAYLALARQEEIRFLISNTTEAGIQYDETAELDATPPKGFPAKLTIFLHERYQHFEGAEDKGCIIIPTELVVDNGTQLQEMILRYAEQWQLDTGFTQWIKAHNTFCNTLVDRIVPGYPQNSKALQAKIGFEDNLLVMGEPYYSWIIQAPERLQDELPTAGVLDGIKIVDDVAPYRQTKVRILNGLHSSMVPIGLLLGLETVGECMQHEALLQCLQDECYQEIIPSMDLASDELETFADATFDRFRNPAIHHELMSIALNSSTKMRTRILPTVLVYHEKFGRVPQRAVLAIASFIRLYKGEWAGEVVALKDEPAIIDWFRERWQSSDNMDELVASVLENESLWQADLTQIDGLHSLLSQYLTQIDEGNLLALIEQLNG